jgi:hypothetical protein
VPTLIFVAGTSSIVPILVAFTLFECQCALTRFQVALKYCETKQIIDAQKDLVCAGKLITVLIGVYTHVYNQLKPSRFQ